MSANENGNWHNNAFGGGLPFRPPTVDEALPYSPFTSVVPFSPDVIPFPIAEPPTPPSTLSPDQQNAARKAIGILNDEIKRPPSAAQHLENTFLELRKLLGNPHEMTEYHFKSTPQLATPPPDGSPGHANGDKPSQAPVLSPFASTLLRYTDVPYIPTGAQSRQQPTIKPAPPKPSQPQSFVKGSSHPVATSNKQSLRMQNAATQSPSGTPVKAVSPATPRSGPSVVVTPLGSDARRREYRRYDQIPTVEGVAENVHQNSQQETSLLALRSQDRELAEQKIDQLKRLVQKLDYEKENSDESDYFKTVSCLDSDLTIMRNDAVNRLYDRIMVVHSTGCFSSVPIDTIVTIHSLCEPTITITDQSSLFNQEELEAWAGDLKTAESGLRAIKLVLTTMLEGPEDRRIRQEDRVVAIIDAIKRVLELCIIPVLESRRSGDSSDLFDQASIVKEKLRSVLRLCTSVMYQLAALIGKAPLTDSSLNPVEYLALHLLVQQNSDSEKDSIFSIRGFEAMRQAAMEVLTQIFGSRADHQHYIITEILNNLEKLPDKGSNARQFKSARDPPIMTVSALFMRFVQVAATNHEQRHEKAVASIDQDESSDESEQTLVKNKKAASMEKLPAQAIAQKLMSNAKGIANRIATVLTDRALNVSKSGDKPFRNLLDMFVEDFCNVLGSPEWPAASMLLHLLFIRMHNVLSQQSNKDMALAIMGAMGCGIIDFKLRVKHLRRELDISQSDLSSKLDRMAEDSFDSGIHQKDLLGFNGPYRMVIESLPDYLKVEAQQDDPHLKSIQGYYITLWLDSAVRSLASDDNEAPRDEGMSNLITRLETMIVDPTWLSREYKFQNVSESQSQLAANILTLQLPFCQFFTGIVNTMLKYTQENAATLKSRATKVIESFLNKDPQAISDRLVMGVINLLRDNSPLVRTDAVSLVSKCLEGNPSLEQHCLPSILNLTMDPSNGPKKKAIGLLKKIYSTSASKDHKLSIVVHLFPPSQDIEKSIAEMARQALEDIWLKPLDANSKVDENQLKLRRAERASLLVQTVRQIQGTPSRVEAFEKFFTSSLVGTSPVSVAHTRICKVLIGDMVEGVIDPESMVSGCSQVHVLQTLSVFARVCPGLFALDQLQLLKLYLKNPANTDDLEILRPTVTIFRFVLPHLPNLPQGFATEVWTLLSNVYNKLASWTARGNAPGKGTLLDVVHCSWTVSPLAENGITKLLRMVASLVVNLELLSSQSKEADAQAQMRLLSWLILIGTLGKVCNFDEHAAQFRASLSAVARKQIAEKKGTEEQLKRLLKSEGNLPSVLLLATVRPFTKQTWGLTIREHALYSVADVCQGAHALFRRPDVEATFKVALKNENVALKRVALTQFRDFFLKAERPSDNDHEADRSQDPTTSTGRLGITFVASDGQVTTNYLARKFLHDIINTALESDDDLANLATHIITSISRQGLVHPKECGPALIALGSSSNADIAQTAAVEHKKIHDAHETMFEKEYMAAIRMTFEYQRRVFNDTHGLIVPSYKPKLLHVFSVLKGGNRKTLKKFIVNLCKQMDFELAKLEGVEARSTTVLFARFCLENLALFDVPKLEDIAIITNGLENIVLKYTGPSIGIVIDREMPRQPSAATQFEQPTQEIAVGLPPIPAILEPAAALSDSISDDRLAQITSACIILQMMWETRCFIRKAYNLQNLPGRISHKDFQKPALRNNLISGRELWERLDVIANAVESRESMFQRCYDFADLLNIDQDLQVGEEGLDDDDLAGYVTPDEGGGDVAAVPTSGRSRKRKSSTSAANTPKKPRSRPSGTKKKRSSKTPDPDGWD